MPGRLPHPTTLDPSRAGAFWTADFSGKVRTRIEHAYVRLGAGRFENGGVYWAARQMILEQEGMKHLFGDGLTPCADFEAFLQDGPEDMYPTAIEAMLLCIDKWDEGHQ